MGTKHITRSALLIASVVLTATSLPVGAESIASNSTDHSSYVEKLNEVIGSPKATSESVVAASSSEEKASTSSSESVSSSDVKASSQEADAVSSQPSSSALTDDVRVESVASSLPDVAVSLASSSEPITATQSQPIVQLNSENQMVDAEEEPANVVARTEADQVVQHPVGQLISLATGLPITSFKDSKVAVISGLGLLLAGMIAGLVFAANLIFNRSVKKVSTK